MSIFTHILSGREREMLIIKNGTLISMAGIYKEKYDVAVDGGKIVKVE